MLKVSDNDKGSPLASVLIHALYTQRLEIDSYFIHRAQRYQNGEGEKFEKMREFYGLSKLLEGRPYRLYDKVRENDHAACILVGLAGARKIVRVDSTTLTLKDWIFSDSIKVHLKEAAKWYHVYQFAYDTESFEMKSLKNFYLTSRLGNIHASQLLDELVDRYPYMEELLTTLPLDDVLTCDGWF